MSLLRTNGNTVQEPRRIATGSAWTDLQAEIWHLPGISSVRIMSENKDPEIVWILSGAAVVHEREIGGQWLKTPVKKRDFFLTAPGPAYEVKSVVTGPGSYEAMRVVLGLPVFL